MDKRSDRDDDSLLAAYGRGDRQAFNCLYERYKQPVFQYLRRSCGQEPLAEELFQDVWVRVISQAPSWEQRGRFRAWLFSVAHNCIVDMYRKEGRAETSSFNEDKVTSDLPGPGGDGQHPLDRARQQARVEAAINQLNFEQRQIFHLRELGNFSVRQLADIQGITLEAAKSRLRYTYGKLRELLEEST